MNHLIIALIIIIFISIILTSPWLMEYLEGVEKRSEEQLKELEKEKQELEDELEKSIKKKVLLIGIKKELDEIDRKK